jgi:hypothetical protein
MHHETLVIHTGSLIFLIKIEYISSSLRSKYPVQAVVK